MQELHDMSLEELRALLAQVSARIDQIVYEEQNKRADARQRLIDSISTLNALIGPDNPTEPGLTSLTEVRLFSQQDMGNNAGLALALAFQALEILARATRDIAQLEK